MLTLEYVDLDVRSIAEYTEITEVSVSGLPKFLEIKRIVKTGREPSVSSALSVVEV